jgi:hypothetical protein
LNPSQPCGPGLRAFTQVERYLAEMAVACADRQEILVQPRFGGAIEQSPDKLRAMAAQPGTVSTTRKLNEVNVDQTFVRELPGDPVTENSLRQARSRFSSRSAERQRPRFSATSRQRALDAERRVYSSRHSQFPC